MGWWIPPAAAAPEPALHPQYETQKDLVSQLPPTTEVKPKTPQKKAKVSQAQLNECTYR